MDLSMHNMFNSSELQRYARHFSLPEVGMKGQHLIKKAKVLCIGTGGLGSSALLNLAAAGVGTIGLVDDDVVDISNLQRQILFSIHDIGEKKVHVACTKLLALNSEIKINPIEHRLTKENALETIMPYDIVIDCTDNFYSRYLINDACFYLQKPNVYASISRFDGQCSVFSSPHGPCYRCLFKSPPTQELIPGCAQAGVIGALPGILGSIQSMEVIKLILNQGDSLIGRLLLIDALTMQFNELIVPRNQNCLLCIHQTPFDELDLARINCTVNLSNNEISAHDLQSLKKRKSNFLLLDVRDQFEYDICNLEGFLIPLNELVNQFHKLDLNQHIIIHCKMGDRSKKAAVLLEKHGFQRVSVLNGGILAWIDEIDSSLKRY